MNFDDYPQVPRHELPENGTIPDRRSPAAVVFLRRLALSDPRADGHALASILSDLADELNAKLPERARLADGNPPIDAAFVGFSDRALAETAIAAMGAYRTPPDQLARINDRQWAFISLERYFIWCHAMFLAGAAAEQLWGDRVVDIEKESSLDDGGEHALACFMHGYAGLCVVLEGWKQLELHDPEIDALIAEGGDVDQPGTFRFRLNRLRNGVFHYQPDLSDDPRFRQFWASDSSAGVWATRLERQYERYFRRIWEQKKAPLEEWLLRR